MTKDIPELCRAL